VDVRHDRSFFLEWVEAGRKIQRSLSTLDPVEALNAMTAQESLLICNCKVTPLMWK
jgi:hypothetical protein